MTCRTPLFRILIAVFAGHCSAHAAFAADPAGQWLAEFDSPRGRQRELFDSRVAGGRLTATAKAEMNGEADIVRFAGIRRIQGNEIRIESSPSSAAIAGQEYPGDGRPIPMEKNAGGFWSVTCGLVAPGFHYCTFLVDGANPCNP
jgi:hypothetical protein